MKKKIFICLSILILISVVFFITRKLVKMGSEEEVSSLPIDYINENNEKNDNQEEINKMVENQGLQADENIYEIGKEYDGREVIIVKSNIKYKVALAGMIKTQKPEFSNLDETLEKAPKHTGIWIPEQSREKFLSILKGITNATYTINEDGFLIQKENWILNEYDKSISKMLTDEKLHIFDISSITYVVDEVTGEIQEYPFEEMDPNTEYEYFESDNKEMFIMSENKSGKVNQEDILKNILQ